MTFRKILAPVFAAAALFVFAACESGHDNPLVSVVALASEPRKTVYKASTNLSDYGQKVVASIEHVSAGANDIPDLFVISGADLATLSEDNIKKAFETSLKGGTVLIDAPTSAQLTAFKTKVDTYFATENGAVLGGRVLAANDSFYNILKQHVISASDTATSGTGARLIPTTGSSAAGRQTAYDAVASRGTQIYLVHDIDEALADPGKTTADVEKSALRPNTEKECAEVNPTVVPVKTPAADWESATKSSVANFSNWLNGGGASLLASRAADTTKVSSTNATVKAGTRPAQTFVHNFTASFDYSHSHYDGRYNGKKENVEVIVDVWAACEIKDTVASSKDWYLVRTSVVCNNQQLGFKNDWDSAKHLGPYFERCEITSALAESDVKTNECSPQNAAGSTSFTTGSSFSLSGNVGFNMSGPTGGVGVGYSESQSSTRSIPDIGVTWGGTQEHQASWSYTTPKVEPYWSWFTTHCDGPKEIQTKAAVFDTYTLYNLDSVKAYDNGETVRLETAVKTKLAVIAGWLESAFDLHWYWLYCNDYWTYNDYVQKPCNTFTEYIMSFKAPDGVTPEQADRLHAIVKEYISDWNSVERYYGVGTADANVTKSRLDGVAKNYFANAKKKITDNKGVFQGRGFKGTFKFYINRCDGGALVDSFDLTF